MTIEAENSFVISRTPFARPCSSRVIFRAILFFRRRRMHRTVLIRWLPFFGSAPPLPQLQAQREKQHRPPLFHLLFHFLGPAAASFIGGTPFPQTMSAMFSWQIPRPIAFTGWLCGKMGLKGPPNVRRMNPAPNFFFQPIRHFVQLKSLTAPMACFTSPIFEMGAKAAEFCALSRTISNNRSFRNLARLRLTIWRQLWRI